MNLEVERKCINSKTANESEDLLSKIASFNCFSWTIGHPGTYLLLLKLLTFLQYIDTTLF